jgi:hypothetical protein
VGAIKINMKAMEKIEEIEWRMPRPARCLNCDQDPLIEDGTHDGHTIGQAFSMNPVGEKECRYILKAFKIMREIAIKLENDWTKAECDSSDTKEEATERINEDFEERMSK